MSERQRLRESFETIAEDYATRFAGELERKPFDREILQELAVVCDGPLLDVGCGPGHVAEFVRARAGVTAVGVDLAVRSLHQAVRLFPELRVVAADVEHLPFREGAFAAITAFYSLIYVTDEELLPMLRELRRVLRPGGALLVAFHAGSGDDHATDFHGLPVDVTVRLRQEAVMCRLASQAGFAVRACSSRPPLEFEYQTRRAYLRADAA